MADQRAFLGRRLTSRTREAAKFATDLGLWTLAGLLAFPLRQPNKWLELGSTIALYLAIGVALKCVLIPARRLHRQSWQQVSFHDLLDVAIAVGVVTATLFGLGFTLTASTGFPRTVPLIEGLLAFMFLSGARLTLRVHHERRMRTEVRRSGHERRVLLVGAGRAGAHMSRDLRRHPRAALVPIGFLDDDPGKRKLVIGRLHVFGTVEDLPRVVAAQHVDEVLITMPTAPGARTRRVVELAASVGVPTRILPGLPEILRGDYDYYRIRDVQVDDLLRRDPAELELEGADDYVTGRTVLVTGAGGSIGAEIVRQVAALGAAKVIVFDHDENSLHAVEQDARREYPGLETAFVVGTIRDRAKVDEVVTTHRPDVVFHAAAHKHVPLLEAAPDEAILNNVGGTLNVAAASLAGGVARFVHTSSDKAVNPASMLGITKLIAERVVHVVAEQAGRDAAYVSVRFGNVLGSQGSVVTVFQDQIRRGGPVTVTHPDMTRYFMTIPEASRLVIQVGALGENGAVYFLDMGTPVRIRELAEDMIRLAGADPQDVRIEYTGLRPGEKLEEELFTADERTSPTRHEKIVMAHPEELPTEDLMDQIEGLLEAARARDHVGMEQALAKLVPGFDRGNRGR
jgi:FlaA1/EpsC-like NDP-sugar epimerase